MQAYSKERCIVHQKKEAIIVCVTAQCKDYRICCPQCLSEQMHKGHNLISISDYKKARQQLSKIDPCYAQDIRGKIKQNKKKIESSLNNFYDTVLQNFMSYDLCSKQSGQQQQEMGQIELLSQDPLFIQATENNDYNTLKKTLQKTHLFLLQQLIQLQQEIILRIDRQYSKLNNFYSDKTNGYGCSGTINPNSFVFSKNDKHYLMECNSGGKIAYQKQADKSLLYAPDCYGFTVHQLVSTPLSSKQNQISFMIKKQPIQRFIYFGLCELNKMKLQNFMRAYQMGGGMIGIRQHKHKGRSAICLHDFQAQFSNKQIVGWDYDIGDKITIRLNFNKGQAQFYKNNKQKFQMPFNTKINYIPFVGLKCTGDTVEIVD